MKDFYNQLLSDTQAYLKTQYQLLQVRSIEQTSQLLGLIITLFAMTAIVVIGLIFLAIALAAWLEQWLPMWASYLVIAGAMLLIALGVFGAEDCGLFAQLRSTSVKSYWIIRNR